LKNKIILRLLFKFLAEYSGFPMYISGNAIRHALKVHERVKFGIFTNKKLTIPDTYEEFFDIRRSSMFLFPHITRIRPRKGISMKQDTCIKHIIYYPLYLTVDILTSNSEVLKKVKDKEIYQFGGCRRLGYGLASLIDYVWINIQELDLPNKASHAVLLSPLLSIPSFFYAYSCRWDREILWNNNVKKEIRVVPNGQFFRLKINDGEKLGKIAGHIGFGEFILCDWSKNEVNNN